MSQLDLRDPKLWDRVAPADMWKRFRETIAERGTALVSQVEPRPDDVSRRLESDRAQRAEIERV